MKRLRTCIQQKNGANLQQKHSAKITKPLKFQRDECHYTIIKWAVKQKYWGEGNFSGNFENFVQFGRFCHQGQMLNLN